jgi:hypothetical protein
MAMLASEDAKSALIMYSMASRPAYEQLPQELKSRLEALRIADEAAWAKRGLQDRIQLNERMFEFREFSAPVFFTCE